jgi:hypothetical protein
VSARVVNTGNIEAIGGTLTLYDVVNTTAYGVRVGFLAAGTGMKLLLPNGLVNKRRRHGGLERWHPGHLQWQLHQRRGS